MNLDVPFGLSDTTFTKELAERGLDFLSRALGLQADMSLRNPLVDTYSKAQRDLAAGLIGGASRELELLSRSGIQLAMVKDWPGYDDMVSRIKHNMANPYPYFHEVSVASLFWLAGCYGEFLPQQKTSPDIKVFNNSREVLVECKRSDPLTLAERRNYKIWFPASSQLVRYLRKKVPSGAIRLYPKRDAILTDPQSLLGGVAEQVQSWLAWNAQDPPNRKWGYRRFKYNDNSFDGLIILSVNPGEVFDALEEASSKYKLGIEVPGQTEAASQILDLTLSDPPKCDGIWYVKIHSKRDWTTVAETVCRLENKSSQFKRFRQLKSENTALPAIVWIDHPVLIERKADDLRHLRDRAKGKLRKSADAVVFACYRHMLSKYGKLTTNYSFTYASQSENIRCIPEGFPYVTQSWWSNVLSEGIPSRNILGIDLKLGAISN